MKSIINLPVFNGFYGTFFECECESIFIDDDKDYNDYKFNYVDYFKRVGNACCNAVESALKENDFPCLITYQSISSPREYNFANDDVVCKIDFKLKDLKRIIKICINDDNLESFEAYLTEHFKSREGFISFMVYDVETWVKEYLKPDYERFEACLHYLLQFYLIINDYNDEILSNDNLVSEQMNIIDCELINE